MDGLRTLAVYVVAAYLKREVHLDPEDASRALAEVKP
jgi:hypothetical protein